MDGQLPGAGKDWMSAYMALLSQGPPGVAPNHGCCYAMLRRVTPLVVVIEYSINWMSLKSKWPNFYIKLHFHLFDVFFQSINYFDFQN